MSKYQENYDKVIDIADVLVAAHKKRIDLKTRLDILAREFKTAQKELVKYDAYVNTLKRDLNQAVYDTPLLNEPDSTAIPDGADAYEDMVAKARDDLGEDQVPDGSQLLNTEKEISDLIQQYLNRREN